MWSSSLVVLHLTASEHDAVKQSVNYIEFYDRNSSHICTVCIKIYKQTARY